MFTQDMSGLPVKVLDKQIATDNIIKRGHIVLFFSSFEERVTRNFGDLTFQRMNLEIRY